MGNYPDVVPGDKVSFNANRENEINRILNGGGGFGDGRTPGRTTPNVRLQAWNSTNSTLQAGKVVQIAVTGATMCGEAFPVAAFSSTDAPFGVLTSSLSAGEAGDLLVSGMATVSISGSSGNYAKPVSGGTFVRGNEGVKILHVSGNTAIILLGDYYKPSSAPGPTPTGGVPAGTIIAYAGPLDYMPGEFYDDQYFPEGYSGYGNIPAGWLHCHGQAVSRTEYADLFAAIGTVYGEGDGSTTFNVPDFRGSFLRGAGHPSPSCVMGYSVIEEEDEDHPGEYIYKDAGYVEVKGQEIESGEALIDGQTVDLTGAVITTSGIVLNGTNYGFSIEISSEVLEVSGAGYVKGIFIPSRDDIYWESQSNMGQRFNPELPNTIGEFWGVSVNGTPYVAPWVTGDPGPFVDAENFYGWVLPFPIKQDPGYSPYATGLTITTYPNYDTFNNVQIFGGTNGIGEDFKSSIGVTAVKFNAYMGQLVGDGSNVYTVGDYIREFQSDPPEEMLTIKNNVTAEGTNLPQRHLVHWLIKC